MKIEPGAHATLSRSFSAADVRDYAALAGASPPPGVVPEPLIGALFSHLLGMRLPGPGTNYLKQESVYSGAARIDEAVTARVEITRLRPRQHLVDLRTTCHDAAGRLLCDGRALVYVVDVATGGDSHAE